MALSAIKKYLSYFTKKLINKHVRPCHATWLAHITVEKQDPILADHFLTKLKRYGFSGQIAHVHEFYYFLNSKSQLEITLLNANSSL